MVFQNYDPNLVLGHKNPQIPRPCLKAPSCEIMLREPPNATLCRAIGIMFHT